MLDLPRTLPDYKNIAKDEDFIISLETILTNLCKNDPKRGYI